MPDTAQTISLTTPLSSEPATLLTLEGAEALSQPFDYTLSLASADDAAQPADILGKALAVTFLQPSGDKQYLHGVITEFSHEGEDARLATLYRVRLRPSFFLLSLQSAYRIFQDKSVPDILEAVFQASGFSAYKNSLSHSYPPLPYVVQYGESTLDFVARLLEQAGIFYFFSHTASAHTLILADDADIHQPVPGNSSFAYASPASSGSLFELTGSLRDSLVPAGCKLYDFNFENPKTSLVSSSGDSAVTYQLAEYPGGYTSKDAGDSLASLRLTAFEASARLFHGACGATNLRSGCKFTLTSHPSASANTDWVLVRLSLSMVDEICATSLIAMPAKTAFRPPVVTPRRRIHGAQTAIVTGKAGEDIWTDQYGRVKLKFHWDDAGPDDDKSSCWVRVAQVWAGKSFGSLFLPRIGQEVIVSFLDGDPERPLIVGAVYNGDQVTPYTLPDDQTKSTFKTQGSKDTTAFNELRFEDKSGSEEVFLQAQKDLKVSVLKGDHTFTVATGKETLDVKGTRTLTITGDEAHTNKADFKQDVTGDFTLKVTGDLLIEATGSITLKSQAGLTAKGPTVSLQADSTLTAKGAAVSIEGSATTAVKGGIVAIN